MKEIFFVDDKVKESFDKLKSGTTEERKLYELAVILEWMDHKNYERRFKY